MSLLRQLFRPLPNRLNGRSVALRRRLDVQGRLGSEQLEQRSLLAADISQVFSPPPAVGIDYAAGAKIPIQVHYSEPVTVSGGAVVARVANGSVSGGLAAFTGLAQDGRVLNFEYSVVAGDNVAQFDVLLDPTEFLIGGIIRTVSDSTPADRRVGAADFTLADFNTGMSLDTTAPVTPTVATTYVNPAAYSTAPTWAALHPNYFVIRGQAGTSALPAGETLSVLVNGATYRPTVDSSGAWEVYLRPLGIIPASVPVSGSLQPWSSTNGDAYDVVATIVDAAGNRSSDGSTNEVVIDTDAPTAAGYSSTPATASYTVGDTILIYVQYDEPIRVVGTPTLTLNVAPGPAFAIYDPVATAAWTAGDRAYFAYTVLPGDSAKPLDATALNLNGGAIEDLAANPAGTGIGTGTLGGVTIDTAAPVIVTPFVNSASPDGTYVVGSPSITLTVEFDEPVVVSGGIPELALNSAVGAKATYSGGSGTTTLSFTYVVLSGHSTPDLDYTSPLALTLNGAAIEDAAGNAAVLTLPGPKSGNSLADNVDIAVVATPTVIQVTTPLLKGTYTAGQTIPIWVMFTETINVVSGPSPTLLLNTTPTSSAAVWNGEWVDDKGTAVSTSTNILLFEYLVQPSDTTAGAFLNYASVTAMQSAAGIGHSWTTPASPGFLAANTTLPVIGSSKDLLPFQIKIGPDTVAPVRPGLVLKTDTGFFSTDRVTSDATFDVSGIEPRAIWEYSDDGGATWSLGAGTSFTVPDGSYAVGDIRVRQTDWSGNMSSERFNRATVVIDKVLPALPTVSFNDTGVPGDGITRDGTITVGSLDTSPPTGSIRYSTDSGTTWTVLFPGVNSFVLPAGTYAAGSVLVAQQDLAGNISPAPHKSVALTTIVIDTFVAPPVIMLEADTGIGGTDSVTMDPTVLVSNIEANATWEYSTDGGSTWQAGSAGRFDLPHGTYAAGSVVVRQTDLVGNTASTSNAQAWVIDLVEPTIAGLSAPAGTYMAGAVIPITVTFSEVVFLLGTSVPSLTLSTGGVAPLSGAVPAAGTTTMTFNYTVQVNDASSALQVTAMNLGSGTTVGDRAGNLLSLAALTNPVTLAGPVVIDANIRAFSPIYGSDPNNPLRVNMAVTRIPIQFTTPVQGFQLASLRLYWNGRSILLKGARLVGSGAAYTLYLPSTATNLRGVYRLEIAGPRTAIRSIAGGLPMTGTSNLYWQRT